MQDYCHPFNHSPPIIHRKIQITKIQALLAPSQRPCCHYPPRTAKVMQIRFSNAINLKSKKQKAGRRKKKSIF
jgi:hypothetical protein